MTDIIHSPSGVYSVRACLRGDQRRLIAARGDGTMCLLVVIDHPPLARKLIPFFADVAKTQTFTDFLEVFPYEKGLCAAFRHQDTLRPFAKALSGAPPPERAAVLRSLFAYLLTQEPPHPILCDLLRPENMMCPVSGEIGFVYDLSLSADYARNSRAKAMMCLSETARQICGDIPLPSVNALCAKITGDARFDWTALYEVASDAATELSAYTPEPAPEKQGLRERAEALRGMLTARAAAIMVLLLAAVEFILLGVLMYDTVIAPGPVDNGIQSIGTVIVEYDEETP